MFTVAAAPLRIPKALITGGGIRSWGWLILKFSNDLCNAPLAEAQAWAAYIGAMCDVVRVHMDIGIPFRLGTPVLVRWYLNFSEGIALRPRLGSLQ